MNNIYVLNKNYKKIGTLSNQGVNPHAPYYNDLYTQDLETGADTYQFSTVSTQFTQDCIEVGNHIMFSYKNRNELFTITSLEYSHNEGYKTVGVYAESVGFELLDVYMKRPKKSSNDSGDDEDGRDNDDDGDDNYDDEYADVDDVYLDENGIIIYDEKGGTKPNEEDVYVDENGIIIYKPKNNKKYKDRPSDFLEFKNISYPTFIKMILKNTGWSYVCQPGLESNKQDVRVSYDTNIFAILQDSMQDYKGVELEFVYEYNNGKVQKTVKAYKDGGRGSFVGKRFEYGTNVKGITKTQKVANNEDDTVLFIDNIGIEVYYDVDFALKSAEVPEIEIGDTHYVIDSDFHPPMQIKARIGKIEISFTDSTKNKIYLANNKKIRGSLIDDELDDYEEYDDIVEPEEPEDPSTPMAPAASSDNLIKAPRIHSHEFLVYVNDDHMQNDLGITEVNVPTTGLPPSAFYDYIMDEGNIIVMGTPDDLGAIAAKNGIHPSTDSQPCLRLLSKRACSYDAYGDPNNGSCYQTQVQRSIFSTIINEDTDKDDFGYYTREKNDHGDEHLLDVCSLTCATILALRQHLKKGHGGGDGPFQIKTDSDNKTYYYTDQKLKIRNDIELIGDLIATEGFGHIKCRELNVSDVAYIFSLTYSMMVQTSDRKLKENIRYIDSVESTTCSDDDLLEKTDLYDFIVNQVNLCEYNFIGDDNEQIGFIANEYEGTKVGDKIISRDKNTDTLAYNVNNLLFATIGALQEEVRTRDEKIANLEARLAKIEALLDINND